MAVERVLVIAHRRRPYDCEVILILSIFEDYTETFSSRLCIRATANFTVLQRRQLSYTNMTSRYSNLDLVKAVDE